MGPLKRHLTPLKKRGRVDVQQGKGAVEQHLPSRAALSTLTQGSPINRSMNDYAKATPMAAPDMSTPSIDGGT